jgi:hypothetical protein
LSYEVVISTQFYVGDTGKKDDYINGIILGLTRLGYSPYMDECGNICFTLYNEDSITPIRDRDTDDNCECEHEKIEVKWRDEIL